MNEQNNGKKQVAALWILGILVIILIAIIVGLFIKQTQIRNQEAATKDTKIAQLEQELAQLRQQNENISSTSTETTIKNSANEITLKSKEDSKINIIGDWKASKILNENGEEIPLRQLFGSLISDSNKLTFREDMQYINSVGGSGAGEGNEEGKYTITGNTITLIDLKQRQKTLIYNETNETLTEDYNGDGTRIVTYVKISSEEKSVQVLTEQKIIGAWKANKVADKNGKEVDLKTVFNSFETGNGYLSFNTDKTFGYEKGPQENSGNIPYSVVGTTVKTWGNPVRLFFYNAEDDTLKEEHDIGDDIYFVTYVRN